MLIIIPLWGPDTRLVSGRPVLVIRSLFPGTLNVDPTGLNHFRAARMVSAGGHLNNFTHFGVMKSR